MQRFLHLLLLAPVILGEGVNYDRCASDGPSGWTGSCQVASNAQSPINLCGAVPFSGTAPSFTLTGYSTGIAYTGLNNGHTLQFNNAATTAPTLNVGSLAQTVGRGSNTNQNWTFAQVHLHWGRTNKNQEGSEHYLQGTQYPLEAHLVHFNSAYGNATYASTQTDGLLVVGVFFQIAGSDVNMIKSFASGATTLTSTATAQSGTITLSDVFDGYGTYYAYPGSLTTPGCNAVVTWVVSTTLKTVTTDTLKQLKMASSAPTATSAGDATKLIALNGNFRPLQTQSRTVYISSGTSAACTTPTQPTWVCRTSAAVAASPSYVLHTLGLLCALLFIRV